MNNDERNAQVRRPGDGGTFFRDSLSGDPALRVDGRFGMISAPYRPDRTRRFRTARRYRHGFSKFSPAAAGRSGARWRCRPRSLVERCLRHGLCPGMPGRDRRAQRLAEEEERPDAPQRFRHRHRRSTEEEGAPDTACSR